VLPSPAFAGDRKHAEALAREAIAAQDAGRHEAAVSLFDQSLAEFDHPLTRFFKVRSLVALERFEAARELYRTLLATKDALGPKNFEEAKAGLARCDEMLKETTVRVTSGDLPGATVRLDGKEAGATPLTVKLKRGKYVLRVEKTGYEPAERTVDVAGQDELPVPVALRPLPKVVALPVEKKGETEGNVGAQHVAPNETPVVSETSSSLRIWKWVTLGGAVAALGGGAGLLAQHFIAVGKTPPAGQEKDEVKPYGLYAGASLAAVGVGLGVTSVILFVKDANRDRRGAWQAPTDTAPAAWLAPTPGGFALGVSGSW
jgi:tetratricopeptide (TPR) repeat protein